MTRRSGPGQRAAAPPAPSESFGGYGGVVEVARGDLATVYRAVELGTGRHVALKVVRALAVPVRTLEAFEEELPALVQLGKHPNVVALHRVFSTPEGWPVLVLELCPGALAGRLEKEGPLPAPEVVQVGVKLAGALESAHRAGLCHQDLEPGKILVSEYGEPALAGFGLARLRAAARPGDGLLGFSPLHLPPEVLEGQPGSPRADVYGLASCLYELLVGHGPFTAYEGEPPASVVLRILRDPPPRLPPVGVPVGLCDLLEACLAKEPARRPAGAAELAEQLRAVELEAGWSPTPYVVHGERQAGPSGPATGPVRPGSPHDRPRRAPVRSVVPPRLPSPGDGAAPPWPTSGPGTATASPPVPAPVRALGGTLTPPATPAPPAGPDGPGAPTGAPPPAQAHADATRWGFPSVSPLAGSPPEAASMPSSPPTRSGSRPGVRRPAHGRQARRLPLAVAAGAGAAVGATVALLAAHVL